jgi:hypothetical protein
MLSMGNLGFVNLHQDVKDHEKHLTDLGSNVRKQESLLKGNKDNNDMLVTTLCTDVNDAHAKMSGLLVVW